MPSLNPCHLVNHNGESSGVVFYTSEMSVSCGNSSSKVTLAETTKAKTCRLYKVETLFDSFLLEFITAGESVRF